MRSPDPNDKTVYCDVCVLQPNGKRKWPEEGKPEKAVIDGPTRLGPWAYMCWRHLRIIGIPEYKGNIKIGRWKDAE